MSMQRCSCQGAHRSHSFRGRRLASKRGVDIASGIENALGAEYRICSYERRNTGRSDTVAGTQSPEDVLADIDGLLEALGEDGPLVLLAVRYRRHCHRRGGDPFVVVRRRRRAAACAVTETPETIPVELTALRSRS
ncbi:MAG: alpha/beta fold hydrolase [Aeromicrobium sp.]